MPLPALITLSDGRPGIRTLLQVQTREPSSPPPPAPEAPSLSAPPAPVASSLSAPLAPVASPLPVLDFIASTDTLDRYHEIIDPAGWRLDTYRRNPVFQNAHNYGDILFTIGRALITEIRSDAPRSDAPRSTFLFQRVQFACDVNPIARIAYGLYKAGFLNAVSVGFIPLRWQDPDGTEHHSSRALGTAPLSPLPLTPGFNPVSGPLSLTPGFNPVSGPAPGPSNCFNSFPAPAPSTLSHHPSSPYHRKYLEQELLEVSAVAIPANPDALALGLKAGAVHKSDLRETAELLRALVRCSADCQSAVSPTGSRRGAEHEEPLADCQSAIQPTDSRRYSSAASQLSTLNPQLLLDFARELRRILRRA